MSDHEYLPVVEHDIMGKSIFPTFAVNVPMPTNTALPASSGDRPAPEAPPAPAAAPKD